MNNEDIIRLAEFVGWKQDRPDVYPDYWTSPDGRKFLSVANMPRPHESDADCMQLIASLNKYGLMVKVEHYPSGSADVGFIWKESDEWWSGDDYKQGVCELALKLLGDGDD